MSSPVFVDTSALYAVLDASDDRHSDAASGWLRLLEGIEHGTFAGVTHYGVVVESSALVQRRLGIAATRDLHDELLAVLSVERVDEALHERALTALLAAADRNISLVDWTSFQLMRDRGIDHALAFDSDFDDQGFRPPWV
ncbi:MAG: PIN domain-containing protein [Acidimicrobiaceae bacterium]|nr:PIN domain-containing protein [Acidimicrobiaceae bacterium]MYA73265.1 PIN domain-containing protein [Acidimicrobiaceae bacterium]MYG56852.1 PIN domain-containing protein [Acidimicrobiaceae bacterium]MYJ97440.1 PIN domain-containing protein [Acidimicrobiaceae bacterium]